MLSPWSLQEGTYLHPITPAFLLSILTCLVIISSCFKRGGKRKKPHLPPSPRGLPLVGHIHLLGPNPHKSLRDLSQKHGPLMQLYLGRVPTLIVSSAEVAREVMKAQDLVFASRPISKLMDRLTYGSKNIGFSPYGEHWRQAKKVAVVHLLGPRPVQSSRRVREEEVVLMVEKVAAASSPAIVDISEVLQSFADGAIKRVVIGSSLGGERRKILSQMMDEAGELMDHFGLHDIFPSVANWLGMLPFMDSKLRKLFKRWDAFHNQILEERDQQRRAQQGKECSESDFVDIILSMHRDPAMGFPTSRNVVKAMWVEMVEVGSITTLATLEWAMTELVKNPGAMERARSEVREVTGRKPLATEDDIIHMSYLKAVIKEALRLHPPAPLLLPRESMEDTQLHGYDIPKQTTIQINAWAIARDPSHWEDPEEFRPERFLDSQIDFKGNDFQYIPFGAGRRICPGINFSMCAVELALANLLHRFDWDLPSGMRAEDLGTDETPGIVARIKPNLRLVAIPYYIQSHLMMGDKLLADQTHN